jgi:hypothetical protein
MQEANSTLPFVWLQLANSNLIPPIPTLLTLLVEALQQVCFSLSKAEGVTELKKKEEVKCKISKPTEIAFQIKCNMQLSKKRRRAHD